MLRRTLVTIGTLIAVAVVLIGLENVALAAYLPRLERMTTDFSPAYLRRELRRLASEPPQTLFLGDSVLWGYQLEPRQTAVALLAARGCPCRNLALKSGSPPNDYVVVRLLESAGVRPRGVVLEINQKVFNESDPAYARLHPALAVLADTVLLQDERAALTFPPEPGGFAGALDKALAAHWSLYAMRADVRETLNGDGDGAAVQHPSAEMFAASYDLTPLSEENTGVRFLTKTVDALRRDRVPVLAFMTPTNHALLHEYIDNADYRANSVFLQRLLRAHGARVLDLDAAFRAAEFLDNDHLTAAGNQRLALLLAAVLGIEPTGLLRGRT